MTVAATAAVTVRGLLSAGSLAVVWVAALVSAAVAVKLAVTAGGFDAHAYWLAGREALTYSRPPGARDAFLYSPLFADLLRPFGLLPWPVFWAGWAVLLGVVLFWLLRPLPGRWLAPVWLLCLPEIENGNVFILIAAVLALGFTRPGLYVVPVLTKVTVGVGAVWFLARGEWRRLLELGAVTAGLVGVSGLLQPAAWSAWVRFLIADGGGTHDGMVAFVVRCGIAVAVVVVAARTGRPWLVAVATVIASPMLGWLTLTVFAAVPRLTALRSVEADRPGLADHLFRGVGDPHPDGGPVGGDFGAEVGGVVGAADEELGDTVGHGDVLPHVAVEGCLHGRAVRWGGGEGDAGELDAVLRELH